MNRTPLERLLLLDRWWIGSVLFVTVGLSWAWLLPMARDMYGSMTGPAAWMMTDTWDAAHCALLFTMWTVMMAGMMLPSVTPTLFLYAAVMRRSDAAAQAPRQVYALMLGYILVWTAFSLLATILQLMLAHALLLTPMMEPRTRTFSSVLLLLAGLYQLTPLKRACLESCRSPAEFLTRHWKKGLTGAVRLGVAHGLFCLGCCWALMLLLFVGGVMNLWCIGLLTLFVLIEKVAPLSVPVVRLAAGLLIVAGIWNLLR